MDEGAFYKAKEELTSYLQAYIDKRFEAEKSLIRDYIGFAGKIAFTGIGIAILTVGFFGLKTYDDVNKSIQAEIKSRFNNENPVSKYEALLKEAAIEGVISSLTSRIQQSDRFFSGDDALSFLTRALQDESVGAERKAQILEFASLLPSNQESFARAARKLIQFDFKDNRESGVRVMSSLLKLYSSADANSFVTDALNIFDKYREEALVVKRVAEMLGKLDAGSGSRIVSKLTASGDAVSRFHVIMFDLRTNPEAKLDALWFTTVIQKAIDNGSRLSFRENENAIDLSELIYALNQLQSTDRNFWVLAEIVAREARQKKMSMAYQRGDNFRSSSKPYVGLTLGSYTQVLDEKLYSSFISKLARAFFVRSAQLSKPSANDLLVLEFWSAKQSDDSRLSKESPDADAAISYRPFFLSTSNAEIRNETGAVIARDRINGVLAVRLELDNSQPRLKAYWRDPMGKLNAIPVSGLTGIERSGFRIRTGVSEDDVEIDGEL